MRKPAFCTADQRLCFRYIVKFQFFLNLKFQASSHLLWLYSPVCVGPGQIPKAVFLTKRLFPFQMSHRKLSHSLAEYFQGVL